MAASTISLTVHNDRAFRFLWIKYVTGFNPNVHCGRCLLGKYSKQLKHPVRLSVPKMQVADLVLDEHESSYIYVCGVTSKWEWNVHIEGRYSAGSQVEYEDERISITVDNLNQIEIDPSAAPDARKEFATCRNWQFGWTVFPETKHELNLFGEPTWKR